MAVLTPQQRNTLEAAVKQARKIAEAGAFNALHGLAVDENAFFKHMAEEQKKLRNNLWAKAMLLGDKVEDGVRKIERLTYELAYETWHKMLFAQFLESNNLLMHPDGVAVTMEDCEELAKDENFVDKWDAAANYASKMLPVIFRTDDPLMQVAYATNDSIKLEEIIDALENEIFIADDALGWVYQFWQSDAKKKINDSGDKIDGEKLPAVTQLFTEPYMVHFLIDNTLGAWWVSRNPGVKPPIKFEYLRLLEDGTPAAGRFEGWPDKTSEVTALDPCMGSGHFVASLFPVFVVLRIHEEGLTKEQATDKVIAENLHGLELDARCTQIAAFNLALTAWKFCGHYKELPEMNLACSGIAPKGKLEDWVKLVGNVPRDDKGRMENGMRVLYDHFQLAPELGSLLDPTTIKADAFTASFQELQPVLKRALENEADAELLERGVMAAGIAKSGLLLNHDYTLVITNVPFLGLKKMQEILSNYCHKYFPDSKHDLATIFIEKVIAMTKNNCTSAFVSPQTYTFLGTFKKLRIKLINSFILNLLAKLGYKAFRAPMYDFATSLSIITKKSDINEISRIIEVDNEILAEEKPHFLNINEIKSNIQVDYLKMPDQRIISDTNELEGIYLLEKYATCEQGIIHGDNDKWLKCFWELVKISNNHRYYQVAVSRSTLYDGCSNIIDWKDKGRKLPRARPDNKAFGKFGISISRMASLPQTIYSGALYDQNTSVIVPINTKNLLSIFAYCSSKDYLSEIRKLDQKVGVTTSTFLKVPFDLEYWKKVADEKYPNGLPKPYSNDPTQWLFHGHPIKTENPLQVALARVLGYRWPAESDSEMELADEARDLIEAVKAFDNLSDEDGIFCIPSVNAEEAGADRLRSYLQEVFAGEWSNQTIAQLLAKEGAASSNLEDWLRKEFFIQHCKLFQNRPFIWHIWDGRNDGFSALINYHKLDKENLSKLIYTYLGDWIRMCEAKKKAGESGAEGLLSAAQKLKEKLEAILQGEAPYDIFVRWKSLEQQPVGWEPDLNDGVRLNIRPFVEAGVLRSKFNVKWGVDRGKNPAGSHWGEVRDNDMHLSLEEKSKSKNN